MNYNNSLCEGCGLPFSEDDDIVVCPECGTPQHRECYKQNNCCVNAHKHGTDFVWSTDKKPTVLPAEVPTHEAKPEKLPCPSCGHLNEPDAKVCENCSMKLIVFGMNLAEAVNEKKEITPVDQDIPDYPAPFALGQGEGFEYDIPDSAQQTQPQEADLHIKRENARKHLLLRFIGTNTEKYADNFARLNNGRFAGFNFAAFFFTPYWFFYRKLYKPGIILLTLSVLCSIFFTPTLNEFLNFLERFYAVEEKLATDEALATAFIEEFMALAPMISLYLFIALALKTVSGFIAYPLYKRYTESSVEKIMTASSAQEGLTLTARLGGTSFWGVVAAFLATEIIGYITSLIMYGM